MKMQTDSTNLDVLEDTDAMHRPSFPPPLSGASRDGTPLVPMLTGALLMTLCVPSKV